ncbi:MAG TPA: (Fe-S)-binding protein [Thermoplasmata archaeon]|nr:(Fe-S)-binding protein [Thermoplasmata archaeon]
MAAGKRKLDLSGIPVRSLIEFDACMRCGECSIKCPTGGEAEEKEERTPRGKIRAVKRIRRTERNPLRRALTGDEKLDKMREELARSVYECTICGMCGEACPLSLDTIDMWESLRASLVKSGLGPMEAHDALVKSIENYDNPWMQPRAQRARWAKRHANIIDATKEQVDLLYYVGCTASYDPEITVVANNLAEIFEAAGLKMGILGKEEKCCGSTLLRLGEKEKVKALALENVKLFKRTGAKRIVTACAGCYKTLYQDYPKLTGEKLPVLHVTQLLAELIENGKIPLADKGEVSKVTYHDPCHLGRHTKMYDWPRRILAKLPGVTLVEMERTREKSRCCGAGGGLKTLDQELVLKVAEKRIEDAEATGASVLVTSCPFCEQTLREAARRRGGKIVVVDITDLIVQRMVK